VGLAETKNFAEGWDAIFNKKGKNMATATKKKTTAKKKPAAKKAAKPKAAAKKKPAKKKG
jgi:hypothetical protein